MKLSYQLYSSRNWPLADTLKMLADTGYSEVEAYGGVLDDVAGFKSLAKENGLAITSVHMAVADLETDIVGCIALAKDLGVTRVYAPYLQEEERPTDLQGWTDFAARLAAIRPSVEAAGFTFGWHNHDFELVDLGGGRTPLDVIADAGIQMELDLGWVHFAGHDVIETIGKYAPLIKTAHIKDRAPEGENTDQDGWADVGAGVMDWAAIFAALKDAGVDHFVVEHDNPSDHVRFAQASYAHLNSL